MLLKFRNHCTRCPETVLQDAGGWLLDLDTVWVAPAPTLGDDKDLGHFFASLQVLLASTVQLSPNALVLNFEVTWCELEICFEQIASMLQRRRRRRVAATRRSLLENDD